MRDHELQQDALLAACHELGPIGKVVTGVFAALFIVLVTPLLLVSLGLVNVWDAFHHDEA